MSNILSIIGIIVSVAGVIISLLLFNASVNNSRKIILNKAIHFIIFDHDILSIFSDATEEKARNITKERIYKFNHNVFMLEEMLKDIDIQNNLGIPIVSESDEQLDNNQFKHTFFLSKTYQVMNDYFRERNLPDFYLMLNEFDDRCSFLQNYERKVKYKRKFGIGPITGIKYVYKRKKEKIKYGKSEVPLIKKIKNIEDFKKYYDKCYCKFDIFNIISKCEKERVIKDIEIGTDEKNRIPITIYR